MAQLKFRNTTNPKPYDLSNQYWACDKCGGEITHKNDPPRGLTKIKQCTCNKQHKRK